MVKVRIGIGLKTILSSVVCNSFFATLPYGRILVKSILESKKQKRSSRFENYFQTESLNIDRH